MTSNTIDNMENTHLQSDVLVVSPAFNIGDVVKHRLYKFRGVIVDIDPEFSNTEEWYQSIPEESRPRKDQPFIICLLKTLKLFIQLTLVSKTFYLILNLVLFIILMLMCFL